MKVFVPFFDGALDAGLAGADALADADLVPFSLDYPVVHVAAAGADDPLPLLGEVQIIAAEAFEAFEALVAP